MRTLLAWLSWFALLAVGGCSTSVLTAACDEPRVSNAIVPSAYIVVLPYRLYDNRRRGDPPPSDAATRAAATLNAVAGLEVLRMAAQAHDTHVTLLEDRGRGCAIEKVYADPRMNGHMIATAVYYWGEVFEDGDRLMVQSHVRLRWNSRFEQAVHVDVNAPSQNTSYSFTGRLPYATVSFPPRLLPVGDVAGSSASLLAGLQARRAPAEDAPVVPMPRRFTIVKRKGSWIELQPHETNDTLWVSLGGSGAAAKGVLPELSFAHALAAYVTYLNVPDPGVARDVKRWLAVFRQGYANASDALLRRPVALADVLEGALEMNAPSADPKARRRAAGQFFARALDALPSESAVLNLAAIAAIPDCCGSREEARHIQERLERARLLDTGDQEVAENLLQWYQLLETKERRFWPTPVDETHRRTMVLREALR